MTKNNIIADSWKVEKHKPITDVGSVTIIFTMLTAIPAVDREWSV
jgi:hypothetical protein